MTINEIDNFTNDLAKAKNTYVIDIKRDNISNEILSGVPLAYNDEFVMINIFQSNYKFDGFAIVRVKDISQYRIHDEKEDFIFKIQIAMNLYPSKTLVPNLSSINEIFNSLRAEIPLVSIEKYSSRERIAWIGKIKKTLANAVWISEITEEASFLEKPHIHYFKSISKVSFDDNYMKTLWEVYRKFPRPVQKLIESAGKSR